MLKPWQHEHNKLKNVLTLIKLYYIKCIRKIVTIDFAAIEVFKGKLHKTNQQRYSKWTKELQ